MEIGKYVKDYEAPEPPEKIKKPTAPDLAEWWADQAVGVVDHGKLLPYEWFVDSAAKFGETIELDFFPNASPHRAPFKRFQRIMEERHKLPSRVIKRGSPGLNGYQGGVEFIKPEKSLHESGKLVKSSLKKMTRAVSMLSNTDTSELDNESAVKLRNSEARLGGIMLMQKNAVKDMK